MSSQHGSLSGQSAKRLLGGELILKGYDDEEIADIVNVTPSAVQKWRKKLRKHSDDLCCLVRKKGSGRSSRLTDEQKQQLKQMILEGATAHGYPDERWTSKIVADLIQKTFEITMAPRTVRDLLPTLGLSPQMPIVKSHKHSDAAVIEWAERTWKRLKKKQRNSVLP
jgi:putative transposase